MLSLSEKSQEQTFGTLNINDKLELIGTQSEESTLNRDIG